MEVVASIDCLPDDVLSLILLDLVYEDLRSLGNFRLVCRRWASHLDADNQTFWEQLTLRYCKALPDTIQRRLASFDIVLPWYSIYRHARKVDTHKAFLTKATGVLQRRRNHVLRRDVETENRREEQIYRERILREQNANNTMEARDAEALRAIWNEYYNELETINNTQRTERNRAGIHLGWKLYTRNLRKRLGRALACYSSDFAILRSVVVKSVLDQFHAQYQASTTCSSPCYIRPGALYFGSDGARPSPGTSAPYHPSRPASHASHGTSRSSVTGTPPPLLDESDLSDDAGEGSGPQAVRQTLSSDVLTHSHPYTEEGVVLDDDDDDDDDDDNDPILSRTTPTTSSTMTTTMTTTTNIANRSQQSAGSRPRPRSALDRDTPRARATTERHPGQSAATSPGAPRYGSRTTSGASSVASSSSRQYRPPSGVSSQSSAEGERGTGGSTPADEGQCGDTAEALALSAVHALASTHRELMLMIREYMLELTSNSVRDAWFKRALLPYDDQADIVAELQPRS